MSDSNIKIQGSQDVYTIENIVDADGNITGLKGGGLGKIFFGFKDGSNEKIVIKGNKFEYQTRGTSEVDLVKKINNEIRGDQKHIVRILEENIHCEELLQFFPEYTFHIEDMAKGQNLGKIYLDDYCDITDSLTIQDRYKIAIQSAKFFNALHDIGVVYLDHKPTEHIFWDSINKNITIIDWNAAELTNNLETQKIDFKNYCEVLNQILNTEATFVKNDNGNLSTIYEFHPLTWDFPAIIEEIKNQKTPFPLWTIILQSQFNSFHRIYNDWNGLLKDFQSASESGKVSRFMEKMLSEYNSFPNLQDSLNQLINLQEVYYRLRNLETYTSEDKNLWKNTLYESNKCAKIASRMAFSYLEGSKEVNLNKTIDLFWLARQLNPISPRYYIGMELSVLIDTQENLTNLKQFLTSIRDESFSDWVKLGEEITEYAKGITGKNQSKLRQIANILSASGYFQISQNELNNERKIKYLEKAIKCDPTNPKFNQVYTQVKQIVEGEKQFERLYEDFIQLNDDEMIIDYKSKFLSLKLHDPNQIHQRKLALTKISQSEKKIESEQKIKNLCADGMSTTSIDKIEEVMNLILKELHIWGENSDILTLLENRKEKIARFLANLEYLEKSNSSIDERYDLSQKLLKEQGELISVFSKFELINQIETQYWTHQYQELYEEISKFIVPSEINFSDAIKYGNLWLKISKKLKQIMKNLNNDSLSEPWINDIDKKNQELKNYLRKNTIECLKSKKITGANEINKYLIEVGENYAE